MGMLANQDPALWDRVEELIERAPGWQALQLHRLHLVAARVRSRRGEKIPANIAEEWRGRAMMSLSARTVLERVRDAHDGRVLLMKGLEVASLYPDPMDRPFRDLDILVDEPEVAQARLIDAGFVELGDRAPHHLPALFWPEVPIRVELHSRPKSPPWLPELSAGMIFGNAIASRTGVAGVLAPNSAAHAVLLAAHSWAHDPLRRLGDVIDIAATLHDADRSRTAVCASEWGWGRLWNAMITVTDAVTIDGALPKRLSLWTRHLLSARDRKVFEHQLTLLLAPACSLPVSEAPRGLLRGVREILARRNDESWAHKIRRSRRALFEALVEESVHELGTPVSAPLGSTSRAGG